MINNNDFELLNVANIPNNKAKIESLLNIFSNNTYSLKDIRNLDINKEFGYSYETFRKVLNHSCIIGIVNCNNGLYSLSKKSIEFLQNKCTFENYINSIIDSNKKLLSYFNIIYILISIFQPSINIQTFYNIFSYISKDRFDDSSLASTGRNLRSVFALLIMGGRIKKYKSRIEIDKNFKYDMLYNVTSLYGIFQKDIININDIMKYLNNYFTIDVSCKILQCMSTYEYESYIWVKASLYKNKGEIKNLNNEYISTIMIKER